MLMVYLYGILLTVRLKHIDKESLVVFHPSSTDQEILDQLLYQ